MSPAACPGTGASGWLSGGADGEDLLRLAAMLEQKLLLLEGLEQRRRVRKDPRLDERNIGFHEPVEPYLEKNWRLIAFLTESALGFGHATPEVYRLLGRGLYELGLFDRVAELAGEAGARDMLAAPLAGLRRSALLELGRAEAAEGEAVLDIMDYPGFADWCAAAGAEAVPLAEGGRVAEGPLRFLLPGETLELDNRIVSTPLFAARVEELEVLAGLVPFRGAAGYYDLGLSSNLAELPPVAAMSRTRAAFRRDGAPSQFYAGSWLVPSASQQYFGNYFHALCQVCCRVALALDSGRLPEDCGVLLPEAAPGWVARFLGLLGVEPGRIAHMPAQGVSVVEEGFVLPMKWDVCPAEIGHARGRLLAGADAAAPRRDYYLLRRNVQNFTRALVDEERFIRVCEARGFAVLDPLDYSLPEQAALFRDAGILMSSSSSACTNMLFTRPGAEVVLVLPRLFWGGLYDDLATACGHGVSTLVGDFVAGSRGVSTPHHPYDADPDLLAAHLDRLQEARARQS